jgi:hypothetical protein
VSRSRRARVVSTRGARGARFASRRATPRTRRGDVGRLSAERRPARAPRAIRRR